MAKFKVTVGRDARVYYSAWIEAESAEAAQSRLSRHGYDAGESVQWEQDGVEPFDNVETCELVDETGETVASYEDGAGWR